MHNLQRTWSAGIHLGGMVSNQFQSLFLWLHTIYLPVWMVSDYGGMNPTIGPCNSRINDSKYIAMTFWMPRHSKNHFETMGQSSLPNMDSSVLNLPLSVVISLHDRNISIHWIVAVGDPDIRFIKLLFMPLLLAWISNILFVFVGRFLCTSISWFKAFHYKQRPIIVDRQRFTHWIAIVDILSNNFYLYVTVLVAAHTMQKST